MRVSREALVAYHRKQGLTAREASELADELFAPASNPDNVPL